MDLRIGVVGMGARSELATYVDQPGQGSVVAAICDINPAILARHGDAFPHAVRAHDYRDLFGMDLNAVLILTPDWTHEDICVDFLEHSIPCFLEKPIAITTSGADRILQTARNADTVLYVGHNMRHMPVVTQLRALIASGAIGEVKTIWCRHFVGNGGDYYFKDWHADRRYVNTLLLQKAAHDIDVIHWLAGAYTRKVSAFGDLAVYGQVTDRRSHDGELMGDWFSLDNWPPLAQKGLNPVVDVEDLSVVNMVLENGVIATYQQCHFAPDYWRNYTVIGTQGRIENFGDDGGDVIRLWNRRHHGLYPDGDASFVIEEPQGSHGGADPRLIAEFLSVVRGDVVATTSPVGAREAVATGCAAADSLRAGGELRLIPPVDPDVAVYFATRTTDGQ